MTDILTPFLSATIRTATPLLLAASGELLVERAGMINIGLEGCILAGAFGALVGTTSSGIAAGYAAALGAGALVSLLFALFVVYWRADQIITGTALTLLCAGLTGTLYRTTYGSAGVGLTVATSAPVALPGLSRIPVIGVPVFVQPWVTYAAYALVAALWWWMRFTYSGLALRAIGERPEAVLVAGTNVRRFRSIVLLIAGALGGLAGATLLLAQAGTFAEGMSAGRGFIAIAIVVLGRWRPLGVALAALFFGAASASQFVFQALGWAVPYQVFLALPYLLTLAALAGLAGRVRAPAALGKPA